jgi:hypothetical protein
MFLQITCQCDARDVSHGPVVAESGQTRFRVVSKLSQFHANLSQLLTATCDSSRPASGAEYRIPHALDKTGFWRGIRNDPFSRHEWLRAVVD